jgi:hypothetical protein
MYNVLHQLYLHLPSPENETNSGAKKNADMHDETGLKQVVHTWQHYQMAIERFVQEYNVELIFRISVKNIGLYYVPDFTLKFT